MIYSRVARLTMIWLSCLVGAAVVAAVVVSIVNPLFWAWFLGEGESHWRDEDDRALNLSIWKLEQDAVEGRISIRTGSLESDVIARIRGKLRTGKADEVGGRVVLLGVGRWQNLGRNGNVAVFAFSQLPSGQGPEDLEATLSTRGNPIEVKGICATIVAADVTILAAEPVASTNSELGSGLKWAISEVRWKGD